MSVGGILRRGTIRQKKYLPLNRLQNNRPKPGTDYGIPECVKFNTGTWSALTAPWQIFWFDIFCQQTEPKYWNGKPDNVEWIDWAHKGEIPHLVDLWSDLAASWKFATNKNGVDKLMNAVSQQRMDNGPAKMEGLTTTKANAFKGKIKPVTLRGTKLVMIYTLSCHPLQGVVPDPKVINRKNTPWLIHAATTGHSWYPYQDTGRWQVDPFPHCGGARDGSGDVPFMLLSPTLASNGLGYDYIPLDNLERVSGPFFGDFEHYFPQ